MLSGKTNEEKIWNYLLAKLGNEYGVAGIMGNLYAESGFRPENLQNSYERSLGMTDAEYTANVDAGKYTNFENDRAGYGICQWTSAGRKAGLLAYARSKKVSISDLEMQLEYLWKELTEKYKTVLSTCKTAKDIRTASNVVLIKFEAPASKDTQATQDKRCNYSTSIYNTYAKNSNTKVDNEKKTGYTNSSLVSYTNISPYKNSPRNHSIDTITIHCYCGQVEVKRGVDGFKSRAAGKEASCNYVVDKNGKIGLVVDEKDRSWCSSNSVNDNRAITIEVASDNTAPYAITAAAMAGLINLCADICKRNNITKLIWSTDKNSRINHLNGVNMTCHRDFAAKACPGDYIYAREGYIADEVNKILNGGGSSTTPSEPESENTSYLVKVAVPALNIRKGPGTNYPTNGCIRDQGTYTIVETQNNWGKLKSGVGWICLDYVNKK